MHAIVNGRLLPAASATVPLLDEGILQGIGLIETMAAFGGQLPLFERHLKRLTTSAERFAIPLPRKGPELLEDIGQLLEADALLDARVRLTTPETVSANAFHQINDTWAVMGDVTWTRNSRLKDLHIEFPGTAEGDEVIRQQWRDTVRVSLGANYRWSQSVLVRAGYAYDQSPVRNAELTHPALPDGDRNWLSLGLNVKVDDKSSIDLAYSYVKLDDVRSNYKNACYPTNTTCTGNGETTKGLYKTYLQLFGLSYNYRF